MADINLEAANTGTAKKKIFLVEDDLFLSDMYRTKFTLSGFEMPHAEDGESALRMIKEVKPDLVLLDIVLPKRNGFDVLKELKKDAELSKVPVILLTNLSQKDDVDKGFELGANDYIIKAHFTPAEVVAKVEKVLAGGAKKVSS
ncbi:MAG: response regulator [Parcubacteria group bacterium]